MTQQTVPLAALVRANEALQLAKRIHTGEPMPFDVWMKVMPAAIELDYQVSKLLDIHRVSISPE